MIRPLRLRHRWWFAALIPLLIAIAARALYLR